MKTAMGQQTAETNRLFSSLASFTVSRARLVILLTILITLFFLAGLRRGLELDVSPLAFIQKGSPALSDYLHSRDTFGDDLYLVVALACEDAFAPETLRQIRQLHKQIEAVSGVVEINSLANVPFARSTKDGASLEKLVPDNADAARLAEARVMAASDRLYQDFVISKDARTAALTILLNQKLPTSNRHKIVATIYSLVKSSGFSQSWLAGDPFSQWRGTIAIKRDLKVFLPLNLLFIAFILWLCFRSLAAVILPLVSIALGLVWLLGLMGWMQAPFTIIALMLPTLMLAIGCSYMIHVLNQIGIDACRKRTIKESLRFISLPVIVSAVTIIAGFLSLAFTGIPAVRETAIYAAVGAGFTMILSLTFLPASLILFSGSVEKLRAGLEGRMVRMLVNSGRWAVTRQTFLYVITAVIVVFSIFGILRIVIDIDYFHFFKPQSETSIGLAEIGKRLAGAVSLEIIVEGNQSGALESPAILKQIADFQAWAESHVDGVDRTLAVTDFIRHANRAFNHNAAQHYTVPDNPDVIQELLSERRQLRPFISEDGKRARIVFRTRLSGSSAMSQAIHTLEQKGREMIPGQRVFATGTLVLLNRTSDFIGQDQRNSIAIALITIFAVLALLFRSWRMGLTALFPNLIPVLFFFGFMGWRGIPLNLTTSLVASVVLGLAVDNAVQFIVRFRRVRPDCASTQEAIIESLRLSGRPIIYANVALIAAFAIFAFSTFQPIESFGLLSAVTILGCLIEDLVLLPARMTAKVFQE